MDKLSFAGLVIGLVAILGGQVLEGGHVSSLLQPTAFLIVGAALSVRFCCKLLLWSSNKV